MATLTIRNLTADLVERIKASAARNHRSMEQEVRELLLDRYGTRAATLERMRQRATALAAVAPEDVDQWIESGRDDGTWIRSSTQT